MKSFLVKNKKPVCRWGMIPDNTFYEGNVPDGYKLAVCPSEGYVIIDVDRHGDIDGFDNIPENLNYELSQTLRYKTKNDGMHYWVKYTGDVKLANKASNQGIDLRTSNGYVVWYPKEDIRHLIGDIKESSHNLNTWLESLFGFKNK